VIRLRPAAVDLGSAGGLRCASPQCANFRFTPRLLLHDRLLGPVPASI